MERYNLRVHRGQRPKFAELPAAHRRRVYGVPYAWVRGLQGGEMFFTPQGWAIAEALLPEHWFDEERYRRIGRALAGATGAVYYVPVTHPRRPRFGLVVKFCRCAQDVGLTLADPAAGFGWQAGLLDAAEFSDPFAEFGYVRELRTRGGFRTKHPLLIYAPAAHYPAWRLGRDAGKQSRIERALAADQAGVTEIPRTTWEPERVYVMVYQWIDGTDLEEAWRQGALAQQEMERVTRAVADQLLASGFAVLDHKPRHIILRRNRAGDGWVGRRGEFAWALVDYELLLPVPRSK